MIDFKDITVVVQGPVSASNGRPQEADLTQRCLASVRTYLPGATILLSTWKGSDVTGLDYDTLVLSEDPGPSNCDMNPNQMTPLNVNRQIVSTLAGLKSVKSLYAVKHRADALMTGNAFVSIFERYADVNRNESYRFLKRRVVNSTWCRDPKLEAKVPFFVADLFCFGLIEDVLAIWDVPLADNDFVQYYRTHDLPEGGVRESASKYPPEQYLWTSFLIKQGVSVEMSHMCDCSNNQIAVSEEIIANNLVLAPPMFSCYRAGWGKWPGDYINRHHYTWVRWQELYKQYCAHEHVIKHHVYACAKRWLCGKLMPFVPRKEADIGLVSCIRGRDFQFSSKRFVFEFCRLVCRIVMPERVYQAVKKVIRKVMRP